MKRKTASRTIAVLISLVMVFTLMPWLPTAEGEVCAADEIYEVTIAESQHCTVELSRDQAPEGTQIEVTAIPDVGYVVKSMTVRDDEGHHLTIEGSFQDNHYGFWMPRANVIISIVYAPATTILQPGDIGGDPVAVNSTDEGMLFFNQEACPNGRFWWDTTNGRLWFRIPDIPETFDVPANVTLTDWRAFEYNVTEDVEAGDFVPAQSSLEVKAQWTYDGRPEKAYDTVIVFTETEDGHIESMRGCWRPVNDPDGVTVKMLRYPQTKGTVAGQVVTEGDFQSYELLGTHQVDWNGGGTYEFTFTTYRNGKDGAHVNARGLPSETVSISAVKIITGPKLGQHDLVYCREGANITAMLRDYYAPRYLTADGRYVKDNGDELIAFTPNEVSSYSTIEELKADAWFLPEGGVDAGSIGEAATVTCYPVWKSDLSRFCGTDHDLVVHKGKPATLKAEGTATYYECIVCGKLFSDPDGKEEFHMDQLVIASPRTFNLSTTSYLYTGSARKPKVTVTDATGVTVSPKHYTVTYSNNTKVGTATVIIKFNGDRYSGTKRLTFKIKPRLTAPTLKVTRPRKGAAKLTWSKVDRATKYFIYVKYPGSKTYKHVLTKSASVKSVTHSKLRSGKTYYYKVRAVETYKGKTYYGPYSKVVKVKIK